jgi:hypothetical protein
MNARRLARIHTSLMSTFLSAALVIAASVSAQTGAESPLEDMFGPQASAPATPAEPTQPASATEPNQPDVPNQPAPSRRGRAGRGIASRSQAEVDAARAELQRAQAQLEAVKQRYEAESKLVREIEQQRREMETPLPEDAQLRVFNLVHIPSTQAAGAIMPVLRGNNVRLSVVEQGNSLIVASSEDNLRRVAELLDALDRPMGTPRMRDTKTLQLRFYWLADRLPPSVGTDPVATGFSPQAYRAVMALGLGSPRIICQHVMSVAKTLDSDSAFNFRVPAVLEGEGDVIQFTGQGSIRGDEIYKLDLEMSAAILGAQSANTRRAEQISNVSGSIATPEQHYVVMGTSNLVIPGGPPKSYPSAFVVYIGRAEPISAEQPQTEPVRRRRGANPQPENNPFK